MKRWLAFFALCAVASFAGRAAAQNAILLVAKPGMADANFSETVLVVTRAQDASPVGVILNRPTRQRLAELVPGLADAENHAEPLYAGGPVMPQAVIAMFASDEAPKHAAFQVVPQVYLSMHPGNMDTLLAEPRERLRLFAGFAGWAPRQLEAEINSGTWYALRVTESVLFRKDTSGMWQELVEQASGSRAGRESVAILAP